MYVNTKHTVAVQYMGIIITNNVQIFNINSVSLFLLGHGSRDHLSTFLSKSVFCLLIRFDCIGLMPRVPGQMLTSSKLRVQHRGFSSEATDLLSGGEL